MAMDPAELDHRFAFHPALDDNTKERHQHIREECASVAKCFNDVLPDGREKSLAMTHLEQVMFWANAAIAREQKGD